MLNLEAVGRQFGSLWAVRDASLSVEPSEIVGIIGPNGAGKSTLFNLIAGALAPTSGAIRFLDQIIDYGKPHQVARRGLARTFQIPKPFKQLTVRENVMLSALRRHHTPRQANVVATATLEFVRILELAEASVASLTVGQLKKAGACPRAGGRARVAVARRSHGRPHASRNQGDDDGDWVAAKARHHCGLGRARDDGDHECRRTNRGDASRSDHRPRHARRRFEKSGGYRRLSRRKVCLCCALATCLLSMTAPRSCTRPTCESKNGRLSGSLAPTAQAKPRPC